MRGGHRRRRRHHHRRGENACASTSGGVSVESHRGEECVGAEMLGRGEDVHRRRERRRGRENSPGRRLVVAASKLRATHTVRAEAMTDRGKCLCACKCVFVCLQFSADSSLFFFLPAESSSTFRSCTGSSVSDNFIHTQTRRRVQISRRTKHTHTEIRTISAMYVYSMHTLPCRVVVLLLEMDVCVEIPMH